MPLAVPYRSEKIVHIQIDAKPTAASWVGPRRPTMAESTTPMAVADSCVRTTGVASATTSRTPPRRGVGRALAPGVSKETFMSELQSEKGRGCRRCRRTRLC